MATIFIKTIIIYLLVLIAVRLMGKRELGQLQPFELVVLIMIADVASVPMEEIGMPILQGAIPIFALLVGELVLSYLNIKFPFFHKLISGKPAVLIAKGKIMEKNLSKQRYSIDDLLEQIRVAGYSDIRDVDYAILEMSGEISIIPKNEKNNVTLEDLNLTKEYVGYSRIIIMDGVLYESNLISLGYEKNWLEKKLKENNLRIEDTLLFMADESGNTYCQGKRLKNE
ncbi:MAG: DUF421 domain-containing protein [Clostridia bacterium]|nr:DUF421 domain-containing protein [Clostridia bacterium]